jgi:nucleoredoxin
LPFFVIFSSLIPGLLFRSGDERAGELGEMFGVEGIPALIIIDSKTGKVITDEGRSAVSSDPEGKEFPWIPKPVAELGGAGLNENACLMLLFGTAEAKNEETLKSFETVAKDLIAHWQAQGEENQPVYFYQSAGGPLEERVRAVLGVEGTGPKLVLMNLPAAERFVHTGDLNEAAFRDVATKYASGQLQTESLE